MKVQQKISLFLLLLNHLLFYWNRQGTKILLELWVELLL